MVKSKISKVLILLYFLVSLLEITGIINEKRILLYVFKPLIIPVLALVYIISIQKRNNLYLAALFFSFLGDVFLLYSTELYFMLGLSSFLITHLFYIAILKREIKSFTTKKLISAALPFITIFILLISLLYKNLEALLLPVIIYGITICAFGTISLYTYFEKKSNRTLMVVVGAVIFIASDSIIALNKFYESQSIYPIAIMVTYVFAQYLICRYMIKNHTFGY